MKRISILVIMFMAGSLVGYAQWVGTNPVYFNAGNVGIGTTTPTAKLHIVSVGGVNLGLLTQSTSSSTYAGSDWKNNSGDILQTILTGSTFVNGMIPARQASFISNAPNGISLVANNTTGSISFGTGGFLVPNERMRINSIGNVGIGKSNPAYMLDVNGTINATALYVNGTPFSGGGSQWATSSTNISYTSGNVGIGTINPTQKLTVNGTIYSKEVKVDLSVPGPDYVFEETYNLPSLTDTETYIKQNKHLPEVPSACEMEENGINLSEMNMLLLKKVEELTLYLLKQEKTIAEQNERLLKLENEK